MFIKTDGSNTLKKMFIFFCLVFLLSFFMLQDTYANPMGGNVAAGNITIQQAPNVTTINQTSSRGIINWQSFNIGGHEATQ